MPERRRSICLAVALVLAVPLFAQSRPNFAGKWIIVIEKSTPTTPEVHQREITIAQDAQTITLTQIGFSVSGRFSSGGPPSSTVREEFQYSTTYNVDGADHPTPKVRSPNASTTPPPTGAMQSIRSGDSTYRAIWTRDQLVIMTRDTTIVTSTSAEPRTIGATARKAFSLDADGLLVIDSIRISDPTPNGPTQRAPVPVRSVYRKAS